VKPYKVGLDDLERSESWLLARRILSVAICAAAVIGLMAVWVPVHTNEVVGVVTARHADSSDDGVIAHFIIVQLDGGETVKARVFGNAVLKPGQRVALTESSGMGGAFRRFRFARLIEQLHPFEQLLGKGS
jgi:hypothetical protein